MKIKKKFLLQVLTTSVITTSAITQVNLLIENSISQLNSVKQDDVSTSSSSSTSGLKNLAKDNDQNGQVSIPTNYYVQNDIKSIANDNGPILLFDNGKAFGATDWYGNLAWYISLGSSDGYYSGMWFTTSTVSQIDFSQAGTKVVDWDYNHSTDNLYVLTDTCYLIIVQSKTGQIVSANKVSTSASKDASSASINKIQIIDFNSSVYLWNSTQQNPTIYQVDPKTGAYQNTITSSETNSAIKDKYLFALIPLDVNYSIAVTSETQVNDTTAKSNISLNLDLVTDKMVKLITNTNGKTTDVKNSETVSINNSISGKDIYTNAFKRNSDYVVFVYDKMYTLSLNKSSIEQSNFTEINESGSNSQTKEGSTSKGINSAYIDSSNQVYFKKDDSTNISYIAINNNITNISLISSSNSGVFTSSSQDEAKKAQVFPIPISSYTNVVSNSFTGYVLSPSNFKGTGFKNNSLLTTQFTNNSQRPQFTIQNVGSVVPSSISKSAITIGNTMNGLRLDTANATLIADDIAGVLYVKVPYIITQPWYSSSSSVNSSGYLIGKMKCQSAKNGTTWASDAAFTSLFGKLEPNQINETMLNDKGTQILNIPQSILGLSNNQLSINFIIKKRESTKGKITLTATISYVNAYGLKVSYQMGDQDYTIKTAASNYDFSFAGVDSSQISQIDKTSITTDDLKKKAESAINDDNNNDFLTLDISAITSYSTVYANYANTLPSFWQVEGIKSFIVKSDKYPSDPVITVLASNDDIGAIIISVVYNNLANTTKSRFAIKYKGITTTLAAKIKFQGANTTSPVRPNGTNAFTDSNIKDITKASGFSNFNSKLASDVKANMLSTLYSSPLISYMGFTPNVSIVDANGATSKANTEKYSSLDLEYGSILVKLDFSNSESSNLINSSNKNILIPKEYYSKLGLDNNGCVYQRYIGMLPIASTYGITLNTSGTEYKALIMNNNVNSSFSQTNLLEILNIKGYQSDEVYVTNFSWSGENLIFTVHGQSKTYDTVNTTQTFNVNWGLKFASARQTSLIVAIITSLVGISLVSIGIALYVIRRHKIRKMLK